MHAGDIDRPGQFLLRFYQLELQRERPDCSLVQCDLKHADVVLCLLKPRHWKWAGGRCFPRSRICNYILDTKVLGQSKAQSEHSRAFDGVIDPGVEVDLLGTDA